MKVMNSLQATTAYSSHQVKHHIQTAQSNAYHAQLVIALPLMYE